MDNSSPLSVLICGIPAAGKTTLAEEIVRQLEKAVLIDGDHVRDFISADLGFSRPDRSENLRRIAGICRLVNASGFDAVASVVAPFEADRNAWARATGGSVVWVRTPPSICYARDPKGLYAAASSGIIHGMTGAGGAFEIPYSPKAIANGEGDVVVEAIKIVNAIKNDK